MARWKPNAVDRLVKAAMELYRDPGYDKVTVAELAARAGLTPRTFFRYFPDKREVLFFATARVEALVTDGVMSAPPGTPVIEAVAAALAPIAQLSDDDPAHAELVRQRHAVIQANAELRERELGKHAALSAVTVAALRRRGVSDMAARLAAEAGLATFQVGFQRWIDDPKRRKLGAHVREAMQSLTDVVGRAIVLEPTATPLRKPATVTRRRH